MNDKPIKVGDRVRHAMGREAEVLAKHDLRLWIFDGTTYATWPADDCTRLPRTRKVERWVYECRDIGPAWTAFSYTKDGAEHAPYRISAPVRVELEVEEET